MTLPLTNTPETKRAIDRARRAAARHGLRVEKSRTRNHHANDRGGLMLVDSNNIVMAGANYDRTPERIILAMKAIDVLFDRRYHWKD
jgi:hypothetical protein